MKRFSTLLVFLAFVSGGIAEDLVTLAGTPPLTMSGDLSAQMHQAALRDMDQRIADAPLTWTKRLPDFKASPVKYFEVMNEARNRLKQILGFYEAPHGIARNPGSLERFGDAVNPAPIAEAETYRVWQVRWPIPWPAMEGIHGEGLLLEPRDRPRGAVVALPDADQSPEQIAGLAPGVPEESQFARHLVEDGFLVVVPVLIDRDTRAWNDAAEFAPAQTDQSHREWIHRQAYMMGCTVIGFELNKIAAALDSMLTTLHATGGPLNFGVAGYGEGGLLAFHAAALIPNIRATLVSGYFKSRKQTWQEPIYRNVWSRLRGYSDAEVAALYDKSSLIVEYSEEPQLKETPTPAPGVKTFAAPGKLTTPPLAEVEAEFQRIESLLAGRSFDRRLVRGPNGVTVPPGSPEALAAFEAAVSPKAVEHKPQSAPKDRREDFEPAYRQWRQMRELELFVQKLVESSGRMREKSVRNVLVPEYSVEKWTTGSNFPPLASEKAIEKAAGFRKEFWEEILGKIEEPLPPPNARTRKIYDQPKWTGYEVVVDVGGEGFAWGVLCVPKDLKPGEKRPVVVCQHGRHGVPADVIAGDKSAYHDFAARLADQGFITFAPHNLYQKEEYYRTLSRKGNTIGLSMFSVIVRHHQQWLNWLGSLPFVDAKRIAFYGLSYGGETAVRVPPLLEGYCLSICSGDFNDWTRKVASTGDRHSFMFSDEWEMPYFNMGSTFSYAELSYLMFPRPFMVERGHHDQVAPDEWVAAEYAKTRWFYDQFGLGDRTAIEFFNGGHTINGQGTFQFLHQHLHWPEPAAP